MIIQVTPDGIFHIYEDDDPNIPGGPSKPQAIKALGVRAWDDSTGEILYEAWFDQ